MASQTLQQSVTTPSLPQHETATDSRDARTLTTLRRFVLALLAIGLVGTAADLLLTGHFEDLWQLAPLIVIAVSALSLMWHVASPSRTTVRAHQTMMLVFIVSGAIGTFLHYKANIEFELEMYPGLAGGELLWKAIQGASPPSLAPGAMAALGLLGLIYSYKHPALTSGHHDRNGAKP